MRKNFYSILLTAALGLFGMNAWAQDYEISTAQEFIDFAEAVNGGETTANAVLTDDIDLNGIDWTPIGNATNVYTGTFDGGGFTISNFSLSTTSDNSGLFGKIGSGAVVKNFTIEGSITSNNHQYVGGVVGCSDGAVTISNIHSKVDITCSKSRHGGVLGYQSNTGTININNCTYSGTLTVTGNVSGNFGGIVGLTQNSASAVVNITNCLFDGEIDDGTGANAGGIVGYSNKTKVTIKDCLSIGTITATKPGQFIGQLNASNSKWAGNNYYVDGSLIGQPGSGVTMSGTAPEKVTDAQLASGEICFLLNESVSGGENWFQTLMDDNYPFPFSGGAHDPVYANGSFNCDGVTPKEGSTVVYSNTNSSTVDPHTFADGFCSVCGAFDATYMTANADGIFEIGTPAQLKWFAVYVNQVDPAAGAILTANIDLSSIEWTPIGKGASYSGTFDGKNFTISNFNYVGSGDYNGLFGKVVDATIKNFSISGTLACAGTGSGVVGWSEGAMVSNIHSALTIEATDGTLHHAAGIVGDARNGGTTGGTTVDRCSFSGTMTVNAASNDCFGGIVGYTNEYCLIKNCINYGTITYENPAGYVAGIIGYVNNASCYGSHNCLNVGQVVYNGEGDATYGGAIVGRLRGNTPALWGDSYYLAGSAANASGENSIPTNYEVTAAQLASGEVAAKLAPYIRQNIGTDATPVLDPTHNVVAEITAAGYATLYVPDADVIVPAGVTAFTGEIDGKWLKLTEVESTIPAKTAVVLKGAEGLYEFAVDIEEVIPDGALKINDDEEDGSNALVKGWAAPVANNDLKGADTDIEADGKHVLAKPGDEPIGFYKAKSGTTIKAGKAYLEVPDGSSVKGFIFVFGDEDPTGISTIDNGQLTIDNEIYNLAGQRIQKMQKGINIVNGKKVMF
ncbi:MAG: hypothetical protein IJS63_12600 [Bacteroidaceae bacterium]|nr:hypothetical protein [Bacteroidaceae bacterium]